MREEGDTLIIPVVEEELIVQKRFVLKEEIHVRRRRTKERVTKSITLAREHAVVERLDSNGNVIR
jgi:stress response protein YsnF